MVFVREILVPYAQKSDPHPFEFHYCNVLPRPNSMQKRYECTSLKTADKCARLERGRTRRTDWLKRAFACATYDGIRGPFHPRLGIASRDSRTMFLNWFKIWNTWCWGSFWTQVVLILSICRVRSISDECGPPYIIIVLLCAGLGTNQLHVAQLRNRVTLPSYISYL